MKALVAAEWRNNPYFFVGLGSLAIWDVMILLLAPRNPTGALQASLLMMGSVYLWGAFAGIAAGTADREKGVLPLIMGLPLRGSQVVLAKGLAVCLQLLAVVVVKLVGSYLVLLRVPVELLPVTPLAFLLKLVGLLALSLALGFLGLAGSLISQPGPRGLRQRAFVVVFWLGLVLLPLLGVRLYRLLEPFDPPADFNPFGLRTAGNEIILTIVPNTPMTLLIILTLLVVAYWVASWLYERWLEV